MTGNSIFLGNMPPLWLAPMAGVTDKPFRTLAREQGCDLAFTEMISAQAIQYKNRRTWQMLDLAGEHPIGVQLFGSDPAILAAAAKTAQREGADLIDINMGCPVPKVVNNGEGAALMRNPALACAIVEKVVAAVSLPVTVKIRSGWDRNTINAVSLARGLAAAGAAAVTVHGRTREQYYSGAADWNIIAKVVQAVDIPVIGNGDIWNGGDAKDLFRQTGCSGVMLARGTLGNPWLFAEANAVLKGRVYQPPSPREKIAMAIRHLQLELAYRDEKGAVFFMRKHLAWYLKGLPNTAALKKEIFQQTDPEAIETMLWHYIEREE